MNSYILANQMASQHHRELINEAAGRRRGREARRAARAFEADQARKARQARQARQAQLAQLAPLTPADTGVYCRRAAAYTTTGCAA